MKHLCAALVLLSSITLVGCVDRTPAPSQDDPGRGVSAIERDGEVLELPVSAAPPEAFPLVAGSFVAGEFHLPEAGVVSALSVQIGNYAATSDGNLAVQLCQRERCAEGTLAVAGSVDNAYFEIPLSPALPVTAGEAVSYRIVKAEGSRPVAIWLYPRSEQAPTARINDRTAGDSTPRLAVRL